MATHASADKAARQALRRREINQARLSELRTQVKKLRSAILSGTGKKEESKTTLLALLGQTQQRLMKAANHKVIEKGTASRQIARLSAAVHRALTA